MRCDNCYEEDIENKGKIFTCSHCGFIFCEKCAFSNQYKHDKCAPKLYQVKKENLIEGTNRCL